MAAALLESLRRDAAARLKWRVCSMLGIAPFSRGWMKMTRRRVLWCALHLVLDARERGEADARGCGAAGGNPGFDEARFLELRRAAE